MSKYFLNDMNRLRIALNGFDSSWAQFGHKFVTEKRVNHVQIDRHLPKDNGHTDIRTAMNYVGVPNSTYKSR